jgi:RNA polymerase sigma-70 factor (ECF subfamily)
MFAFATSAEEASTSMNLGQRITAIFEKFRRPVFRYLLSLSAEPHQAEEITQEVFLRLYLHLYEGNTLDNPMAWLFTVARNLVVDASRVEQNVTDLDQTAWKVIAESKSAPQLNPEQLALQQERLTRLHLGILRLTPLQRQSLHLRVEGLRYREIAELLGVSVATVAEAVRRGLVNLAAQLNPEEKP